MKRNYWTVRSFFLMLTCHVYQKSVGESNELMHVNAAERCSSTPQHEHSIAKSVVKRQGFFDVVAEVKDVEEFEFGDGLEQRQKLVGSVDTKGEVG